MKNKNKYSDNENANPFFKYFTHADNSSTGENSKSTKCKENHCWGFRPAHPVEFVADIVGAILANGWSGGCSWWKENGVWKIGGVKGEQDGT